MKDESSILALRKFEAEFTDMGLGSNKTITRLVLAAVSNTDSLLTAPPTPDDISPQVILRLITYCYAKGIYSSDEIERKLRKSPMRQHVVDAKAIRRFRRLNRVTLQNALAQTLELMHHPQANAETLMIARRAASEKVEAAAICDMSLED